MENVVSNAISKVIFKEEYISIGPYMIDIGKIVSWVKNRDVLYIHFIGTPNEMIIRLVDDAYKEEYGYLAGEGPYQEAAAPHHKYDRLEKENFNALIEYLEKRFKPKDISQ